MKKIFLLTLTAISALGAYAQETKKDDTLKVKWKNSRIWIFDAPPGEKDTVKKQPKKFEKRHFARWGGIDLGVSMLTTIDNKFILPTSEDTTEINNFLDLNYSKSLYLSLNPIETNFRLYKNYVILGTGLGIEVSNYNFNQNITLDPHALYVSTSTSDISDSINFTKNKLKIAYLKMPLYLQFNTNNENPKKSFHFLAGLEFAYKISSRTKQVYYNDGYKYKIKRNDDYHLADFKYSFCVRVGYGDNVTLFVNYGLSELFEGNSGPDDMDLFPFTPGISIDF